MSSINTGSIDVNYPVPGVNNNSQGFRDNFNGIKNNLDTAATEITDLQNKVIVKSPLLGSTLNNDMNNTLISNALVQGFRHVTYNLGSNLSGTVNVDYTRGDVQYGTITGSVSLTFSKWPPNGTQASVEIILSIASGSESSTITFPSSVDSSKSTLENYLSSGSSFNVVAPAGLNQLSFIVTTDDCGATLTVSPSNRSRKSTQFTTGVPTTTNAIATGTITSTTSSRSVVGVGTLFSSELVVGRAITNNSNVVIGTIESISSDTTLTLVLNAAVAVTAGPYKRKLPVGAQGDRAGAVLVDSNYMYVCTDNYDGSSAIWKRTNLSSY